MPTYRFDAFQLNVVAAGEVSSVRDILDLLANADDQPSIDVGGYTRDLWKMQRCLRSGAWVGQFRKFRQGDLPLVGAPGEEGEELEIAENQGLIEKNFFLVVPPHDILVWHVNGHANTPMQFCRFLSKLGGTQVSADPILQPDAMRRLMQGKVELRKIHMRVAQPTDPSWYPSEDFSKGLIELLAKGGGDALTIQVGVDGRLAPSKQTDLVAKWKRAVKELVSDGIATSAKVDVLEDGYEYPIDLIADRLVSFITVDHDGRYAPTQEMISALKSAWTEIKPTVVETFGGEGGSLRR